LVEDVVLPPASDVYVGPGDAVVLETDPPELVERGRLGLHPVQAKVAEGLPHHLGRQPLPLSALRQPVADAA